MPTTEQNCYRIQLGISEKTIPEILDALNEVQKIVYGQNCAQTLKYTSEGLPPYLVTADGIYEYDCPADCRTTAAVLTLEDMTGYTRGRNPEPRSEYYFRGKQYMTVPATSVDATIDTVGTVRFRDNPGASTTKYYHAYYIKPTELSDISIQLTLPEETHYLLRQAVVAMLTMEGYGESQFDDQIIDRIAKKIRNKLNGGWQGGVRQTPYPTEYMRFPGPYYDS